MKKIYSLALSLVAFVGITQAQTVIFKEDFSGGMPANYILYDVDGNTPDPALADANYDFSSEPWIVIGTTTKLAIATSYYSPAGQADDWMVIPGVTITNSNTYFKINCRSYDANYRDSYEVLVSTTGTERADFTDKILDIANENSTYTLRGASLDAYIGQTINIAVRLKSNDKILFIIDYIEVAEIVPNDLELVSIATYPFVVAPGNAQIQATVRNNGANTITSAMFKITDGTNDVDFSQTLNLAPFQEKTITLTTPAEVATTGKSTVRISAIDTDDDMSNNTTDSLDVYGLAYKPEKMVLFEEGTGTWCGWCPRGTVGMDNLKASYPETTALIAVHNADPMVVSAYDSWMGTKISGYPSGLIDRDVNVVDPGNFVSSYSGYYNKVSPGAIEVVTSFNETSRQLSVTAVSKFATSMDEDVRIAIVLTEDKVKGTTSSWAQTNYYAGGGRGVMGGYESKPNPVPASQMVYDHVARKLLTDAKGDAGSLPASIALDVEYSYTKTSTIPTNQKVEDMEVIVMAIDNKSGKVLATGKAKALKTGIQQVGKAEFAMGVQQNPFVNNLQVNIASPSNENIVVTIYDSMGRVVYTANENVNRGDNTLNYNLDVKAGMYMLNVTMGNKGSRTQQIIAQ